MNGEELLNLSSEENWVFLTWTAHRKGERGMPCWRQMIRMSSISLTDVICASRLWLIWVSSLCFLFRWFQCLACCLLAPSHCDGHGYILPSISCLGPDVSSQDRKVTNSYWCHHFESTCGWLLSEARVAFWWKLVTMGCLTRLVLWRWVLARKDVRCVRLPDPTPVICILKRCINILTMPHYSY